MQPYFFPYIGYFQLMRAVDRFVFFDDVQYINRGWVNRNRIPVGDSAKWLTFPVAQDNRDRSIRERHYMLDDGSIDAIKRKISAAYSRAPAFAEVFPVVESLLDITESAVSIFNVNALVTIARRMGLQCGFMNSSDLEIASSLRGQDRVLAICSKLGATQYVNAIGGRELYDAQSFSAHGIELSFLRSTTPPFQLANGPQYLSILHHLMHLGFANTAALLDDHEFVTPGG